MNPSTDNSSFYRIVMVGDTLVGKTSIVNKLIYDTFNNKELPTIGSMFALYTSDSTHVDMQIWDTAGQERFRSLTPIYFQNADAGVFVFDVSNPSTFQNLDSWISLFTDSVGNNAFIVIIGNKIDLQENCENINTESLDGTRIENKNSIGNDDDMKSDQNESENGSNNFVDEIKARKWAESKNYTYFSTSAKNGYGIHDAFQYIGEELLRRSKVKKETSYIQPQETNQQKKRSFCFC